MDQVYRPNLPVSIESEMKKSYIDYAMSVIVGRAIPDIRDGLKPVHRRAIFAMSELGNRWNKSYKKSARVVGDIIGKYHPHGDSAAYDTVVRMAQDFSMRYPLVDGQGNFGSLDGDPAAAMRYTEIRMARITEELIADLEKDTVDFAANYDGSLEEPTVFPAKVPLLLLNGTSGIAVGVTSNIPPHNLTEIIDGTIALIRNPAMSVDDLMRIIKGPDFPTAGYVNGREGIVSAYKTGRGIIRVRAKAMIERNERSDRESIVVTEIPYMVNKASLIEKISQLVKEKKISGISDLRDESDRDGIRIVIDLKREEISAIILNQLYKHTQMESTFGIIMLAIDNGQPRVLNLADMLLRFVDFRKQVVTRRTVFELARARERMHILAGLIIALDNIDDIIAVIKGAATTAEAAEELSLQFGLSPVQTKAILEMRLQRLTGLEQDKIRDEHLEVAALVSKLEGILADPQKVLDIIVDEMEEIKERYGDERRTEIVLNSEEIDIEDMIVEEDMVITITHQGYIKRNPVSLYRSQHRGGRGKVGMGTKEDDFVERLFIASTHSHILFFTNTGKVHWLKIYQIPQGGRAAKGKAIVNLIGISSDERITAVLPVVEFIPGKFIVMATKYGIIKKTDMVAYSHPRAGGIIALTLDDGDELIDVRQTDGDQDILLGTRQGKAIRFHETEARAIGRTSRGVTGIRMDNGDELVGMEILSDGNSILTVSEKGFGKRTDIGEYRRQSRGGKGIINLKTTYRVGLVTRILQVTGLEDIMLISNTGKIIRLGVNEIPLLHRSTQGVKLIELDEEESFVGLASVERTEEERENDGDIDGNGTTGDETQNDIPDGEPGRGDPSGDQD